MRERIIGYSAHPIMGSFVVIALGTMLLGLVMTMVSGPDGWQEKWCEYNLGIGAGNTSGVETVLTGPTQDCTAIDSGIWELWKLVPWMLVLGQFFATLALAWPTYLKR